MCDCRKSLTNDEQGKIKDFLAKHHKATIKSMSLKETAFPLVKSADGTTRMECVTCSTLKIETNEKKRPVEVSIMHGYCPFCGVKYGEEVAL